MHYLKADEWFMETALALLGREAMWDAGRDIPVLSSTSPLILAGATDLPEVSRLPPWTGIGMVSAVDSLWGGARLYGSPMVRTNGYICEGRLEDMSMKEEYVPNEPTSQLGRLGRRPSIAVAIPEGVEVSGAGVVVTQERDEVVIEDAQVVAIVTEREEGLAMPPVVDSSAEPAVSDDASSVSEPTEAVALETVEDIVAIPSTLDSTTDDSAHLLVIQPAPAL